MKTANFHPGQKYRCQCCGKCCTGWDIPVRPHEHAALSALKIPGLNLRSRQVLRPYRRGIHLLGKGERDRCVFMDAKNLCRIHQAHGEAAKPLACRLYPFDVHRWRDGVVTASLRFDCPSVAREEGTPIRTYARTIAALGEEVGASGSPATARYDRDLDPGLAKLRLVADAYRQLLELDALPFPARMLAAARLLEYHADRRYAAQILEPGPDFIRHCLDLAIRSGDELGAAITGAAPLNRHRRMNFRHLIAGYVRVDEERQNRLARAAAIVRFMVGKGSLRDFQRGAPDTRGRDPLLAMRQVGGHPGDFAVYRNYLASKMVAMHFCGTPCLDLTLVEGMRHLLLTCPVTHALAALHALSEQRQTIAAADLQRSLMLVDHTFSRSRFFRMANIRKATADLAATPQLAALL